MAAETSEELYSRLAAWVQNGAKDKIESDDAIGKATISLVKIAATYWRDKASEMHLELERFILEQKIDLKAKGNEPFAAHVSKMREIYNRQ